MLTAASAEMPLLVFSILVPAGLVALGLTGLLRGLAEGEANAKKLDTLALIPAVVVLVGLAASVFHLGSPAHMLGMFAGLGSSPLSNEIACAGLSIAVAAVYVVFALVKHPGAGAHKGFGIALLVLGLATAVMTGLAYAIRTIPTWDGAFGWAGQLCLALLARWRPLLRLCLPQGNARFRQESHERAGGLRCCWRHRRYCRSVCARLCRRFRNQFSWRNAVRAYGRLHHVRRNRLCFRRHCRRVHRRLRARQG